MVKHDRTPRVISTTAPHVIFDDRREEKSSRCIPAAVPFNHPP